MLQMEGDDGDEGDGAVRCACGRMAVRQYWSGPERCFDVPILIPDGYSNMLFGGSSRRGEAGPVTVRHR